MALLDVAAIDVRRGAAKVLHGVSLSVDTGEIVALLGSNGVGKSTTLRTISGLHHPVAGRITFDGAPIHGRKPADIVAPYIAPARCVRHIRELL